MSDKSYQIDFSAPKHRALDMKNATIDTVDRKLLYSEGLHELLFKSTRSSFLQSLTPTPYKSAAR